MFEAEFVASLKLLDQGIPRWRLKGSWAGATGYPQFMPSAVLRLRADGDGDGRADIWASEMDGLSSIANFLREAGWRANTPWAIPVRVPGGFDRLSVRNLANSVDCPRVHARHSRPLTMREWRTLGAVVQTDATILVAGGDKCEFAKAMLRNGLVDVLASDNHGDRRTLGMARWWLTEIGAGEQAVLLTETNPERLLQDQAMLPVSGIAFEQGMFDRLRAWWGKRRAEAAQPEENHD